MNDRFYSFGSDEKRGAIEIETKVPFKTGAHIPFDSEMIKNNLFEIAKGKTFYDILGFADSFEHFAISKKMKQLLEDNEIKGWACFPIILKGTDLDYYVFQPNKVAGKTLNLGAVNNYTEKRKLDLSDWNGEGIFTLKDSTHIVCTEKVKKLIEYNKITNIYFKEL